MSSDRQFLLVIHFVTQLQNQRTLIRMNTKALRSLKTHGTPHQRTVCHTLCMLSLYNCKILKMAIGYNMKQKAPPLLPAILLIVITENNLWQRQIWW